MAAVVVVVVVVVVILLGAVFRLEVVIYLIDIKNGVTTKCRTL
jgi:hypothetical protein